MKSHFVVKLVLLVMALALPTMGVLAQTPPEKIVIEKEALYPEGITWDAVNEQFLVGSLNEGTVYAVQADGTFAPFIEDEALISSVGLHVDVERERVLVTNGDAGVSLHSSETTMGVTAGLGIYDLNTGEQITYVDLGSLLPEAGHVANDLTFDADGNVYVTDSFGGVIYKVTVDGEASVWLQDDRFASEGFGLNGLVYHPDGYLIVAKGDSGDLFKIPTDDPTQISEIEVAEPVIGADGLVLLPDGQLVIVTNNVEAFTSEVRLFESSDDWASATQVSVTPTESIVATTATLWGDDVYVLYGRFEVLFNPEAAAPAADSEIRLVEFE